MEPRCRSGLRDGRLTFPDFDSDSKIDTCDRPVGEIDCHDLFRTTRVRSRCRSLSGVILLVISLLAACGLGGYPSHEDPQHALVVTADTTLVRDLKGSVMIRADDVTLDCAGHAITGLDTGAQGLWDDVGILVADGTGVTVRNCIVSGFGYGIELKGWSGISERNRLLDNTLSSNVEDGVLLNDSDLNVVRGNTASSNGGHGFAVLGDVNILERNIAFGNEADGFAVGEGSRDNTFDANTATRNGGNGFGIAGTGHTFERNTARDNGAVGFAAVTGSGDVTFDANTAIRNEIHGFQILEPGSNRLDGNVANGNGRVGFAVEVSAVGNVLYANTARSNIEDGFRILSSENTFKGNVATENGGTGFKADGASNTYSKNAGCGNALVDAMDGGLENRWKDNDFCITWGF